MEDGSGLPRGYRREAHESLGSTNSRALAAAREGDPGRLWVTAEVQTAGRGRHGRPWSTAAGNLAASLLLLDPAPAPAVATLSFVAGLALHRAVTDLAGAMVAERLKLKWPNDLLLDGDKVAGILLEGEAVGAGRQAVVVGFGANCVSHPVIGGLRRATDFSDRGVPVRAADLFARLAERVAAGLDVWKAGTGFGEIRAAWLERAVGIGLPVSVGLRDTAIEGRFEGLDAGGRLIVALPGGGSRTVSAGEVFFPGADAEA